MAVIKLFQNILSPSLSDTIKVNGVAFDLTGSTVNFRMRLLGASALTIDAAATVVSAPAGTVRYDWQGTDLNVPGSYAGWWHVTLASGKTQDTDEFPLEVLPHAPQTAALCDLVDVKVLLESAGNTRDGLINTLIPRASVAIMKEVEREFVSTVAAGTTRRFRWDRGRVLDLAPYDLNGQATTVTLSPEGAATVLTYGTDYHETPIVSADGVYTSIRMSDLLVVRTSTLLFRFGYMQVDVTGTWGFPTVPGQVVQACAITVAAWMRKDVAAFAIEDYGGHSGDALMAEPQGYYALPPAALKLLAPWRRYVGVY